jgi:hypothetical protein
MEGKTVSIKLQEYQKEKGINKKASDGKALYVL